jgi:putative polyhydroxyalkanoate system protein
MPRLTIETSHALGRDEAQRRLKEKLSTLKETYRDQFSDLAEHWNGHSYSFDFKAAGMKIGGTATLGDSQVRLEAQVPLAVMMFKGMIQARVREELGSLLA